MKKMFILVLLAISVFCFSITIKDMKIKDSLKEIERIVLDEKIEEAKNMIDEMMKSVPEKVKDMFDLSDFDYKSLLTGLSNDGQNIWVRTLDKSGDFFDVIPPEGNLLRQVSIESGAWFFLFTEDEIIEITGDEDTQFELIKYEN